MKFWQESRTLIAVTEDHTLGGCYSSRVIFLSKALLFDLDGVLVDSTPAVERVWRQWAVEHSLSPEYVIENAHGRRSIETVRLVAPQLNAALENLRIEHSEIADKGGVRAIAGATELLRSLPAERFAIVTSATRALATARFEYAGLPLPRHLVTADDIANGKPSPDPYLKGAALVGIAAADCLVFEDTPAGIQSARAAGMQVVALATTYRAHELRDADVIIDTCNDVQVRVTGDELRVEVAKGQD